MGATGHIEVVTDAQDSKKSAGAIQSVYFPLPAVCAQHCSDYNRCSNDFALLQGAFVSNPVEQTWESASERISTYVLFRFAFPGSLSLVSVFASHRCCCPFLPKTTLGLCPGARRC